MESGTKREEILAESAVELSSSSEIESVTMSVVEEQPQSDKGPQDTR